MAEAPQRAYRVACPNCGAPVEFRSAASAFAVCSYCQSTLLRDGDALRRIGQSAELFDDHSPLQIGTAGRYQGVGFTLVGRVQMRYAEGSWNEWHALFAAGPDGQPSAGPPQTRLPPPRGAGDVPGDRGQTAVQRSGWLSEDNGQYVFGFNAPLTPAPGEAALRLEALRPGEPCRVAGRAWSVASVLRARPGAVQGELPQAPDLAHDVLVADLRNTQGEVGTLEQVPGGPLRWSIGRAVALADLALTGLAEPGEKTLGARGLACPNCGAALAPTLASTQSIVCGQCKAVVDISQGAGADLAHYAQGSPGIEGGEPQIPLGKIGKLALGGPAKAWQVVGYVERCELPEDADDERSYWREYLLYHRQDGFAFLVDAEDGWSWARPITGVPERDGAQMKYQGATYRALYSYTGIVTYVLGEFYWRLARDERTRNTDYQGTGSESRRRLNREQTGSEVVWSAGESLDSKLVAQAFGLPESVQRAMRRDAAPLSAGSIAGASSGLGKAVIVFVVLVILILLISRCGNDDCADARRAFGENSNEYRACQRNGGGSGGSRVGGGSFGGFSSGGGHK